jgi:hypothetical protein
MKRKVTPHEQAVRFFYRNAGISYNPAKETREQGKRRSARALANAEQKAKDAGIQFRFSHEPYPDTSWMDESQLEEFRQGGTVMLDALAILPCPDHSGCKHDRVLASLGGIHASGFSDPYLRVVSAEIAFDALELAGIRERIEQHEAWLDNKSSIGHELAQSFPELVLDDWTKKTEHNNNNLGAVTLHTDYNRPGSRVEVVCSDKGIASITLSDLSVADAHAILSMVMKLGK